MTISPQRLRGHRDSTEKLFKICLALPDFTRYQSFADWHLTKAPPHLFIPEEEARHEESGWQRINSLWHQFSKEF